MPLHRHLPSLVLSFAMAALLAPQTLAAQVPPPPVGGRPGGPPPAPVAADGIAHFVTYIEVVPTLRAEAVAALKAYRSASRSEPGATRIEVFEQVERTTHFVIVESWTTLAARDAHAAAPSARALRDAWVRLGASGVDERPYKTLTVAAAKALTPGAIHVVSHVDTAPAPGSGVDGPGLLRRLAETSRAEPGNLRFDILQHGQRANHFTIVESWTHQAAASAHATASHTRRYRLDTLPLLGSPLDERLFTSLD